jgi:hypothetical protein
MEAKLFKLSRAMLVRENYPLLFRAISAAWLVWRVLPERRVNPSLGPAIRAVDEIYLAPQPGWKITEPEKIAKIADLLTRLPLPWGRCVQHSLITYRLLNGYGIPASVCYGIPADEATGETEGHAWVRTVRESDRRLGGSDNAGNPGNPGNPGAGFRVVFVSPRPTQPD